MSAPTSLSPADERIAERCRAGDFDRAGTLALELYGAEVFGYLVAVAGDYGAASDAFSLFSERLWRTLSRFAWRCSLRGWAYLLARNALTDVRRAGGPARVALSDVSDLGKLAIAIRTRTQTHLRTEVKSELVKLRESLPEDDQTLLILRVDRDLGWDEIARVMAEPPADQPAELVEMDDDTLKRESARLRKRFSLVKQRFAQLARERGLAGPRA